MRACQSVHASRPCNLGACACITADRPITPQLRQGTAQYLRMRRSALARATASTHSLPPPHALRPAPACVVARGAGGVADLVKGQRRGSQLGAAPATARGGQRAAAANRRCGGQPQVSSLQPKAMALRDVFVLLCARRCLVVLRRALNAALRSPSPLRIMSALGGCVYSLPERLILFAPLYV